MSSMPNPVDTPDEVQNVHIQHQVDPTRPDEHARPSKPAQDEAEQDETFPGPDSFVKLDATPHSNTELPHSDTVKPGEEIHAQGVGERHGGDQGRTIANGDSNPKQVRNSLDLIGIPNNDSLPQPRRVSDALASLGKLNIASSPPPPPPPPKDDKYLHSAGLDSPISGPTQTRSISRGRHAKDTTSDSEFNEKFDNEMLDDSRSEIASIMDQFNEGTSAPGEEEIMSPRLEIASPILGSPVMHPPRKSSLDPLRPARAPSVSVSDSVNSLPPRTSSLSAASGATEKLDVTGSSRSTAAVSGPSADQPAASEPPSVIFKSPPPAPDPEPTLPFDFHRFMEQLRHRTADPVAKFLRSFLLEFGKKQWMVHEQVKIIGDFLEFISRKMGQCDIWRTVSDAEFDNAREGMEKLVMNRLYTQTFSPALPSPEPIQGKGRKKNLQSPVAPGRMGQHQEDVERDAVLAQKVRIYSWVNEDHLDIKAIGDKGRKFLQLAQQELLKINSYRAPRDKVICILNCCKVIFGFLRSSQSDQSADSFVPLLIYTVLHANPAHLVSNVQYILRFRNQDKLAGEAGYYISSLMGAVQFIENLDRTTLTISDEEFEKNVEAAVSEIAERHSLEEQERLQAQATLMPNRLPSPHRVSEKSTISQPEVTPRNSLEAEQSAPKRATSSRNTNTVKSPATDGEGEELAAVAGLLRTIQRPLSTIGRIFSDDSSSTTNNQPPANQPALTPISANTPRLSPAPPFPGQANDQGRRLAEQQRRAQQLSAEDAAARQASAEVEEARRIQRQEHKVVVDTLIGMFPNLDREVIDDVVRLNEGRVGLAVESCLALSNP